MRGACATYCACAFIVNTERVNDALQPSRVITVRFKSPGKGRQGGMLVGERVGGDLTKERK